MENPAVVALYNQYKTKGFEIYGVSLDQDAAKWKAAIIADNLTWQHVSDLKGWSSSAAQLYKVNSIPFTVLLDKDGRILEKGLRSHQLEVKLRELLN
jgi:peroxiredoxin